MGIKDFYKFIKTNFSDAFFTISQETYDNLYIDLNCLLHKCCYNCTDMNHLIRKIKLAIIEICKVVQPTKSVNLFCDGTSPFAKLVLQRQRRMEINDELTLNFTPGTVFLKELPSKINNLIDILKMHLNIDVFIDTIDPGEAEIKIKNKILEKYDKCPSETHILVTTDADVILILTSHISYKQCFIIDHNIVLSLDKLLYYHFKKYNLVNNNLDNHNDYSFLNLLLGNDYLPKINLLTYDNLWNSYSKNYNNNTLIEYKNNQYTLDSYMFINILNDLIPNIKYNLMIKKCNIYNDKLIKNYIDGLIWNFDMYVYGRCIDYHYIVSERNMINILNLIIGLYGYDKQIIMERNIKNNPITSELCGILLLPYNYKDLIDKKYHNFLDKNKYIYDKKYIINNKNLDNLTHLFTKFSNDVII
jgi:hypothetical protein